MCKVDMSLFNITILLFRRETTAIEKLLEFREIKREVEFLRESDPSKLEVVYSTFILKLYNKQLTGIRMHVSVKIGKFVDERIH